MYKSWQMEKKNNLNWWTIAVFLNHQQQYHEPHLTTVCHQGNQGNQSPKESSSWRFNPKVHNTFIEVDVDELNGAPAIARTKSF